MTIPHQSMAESGVGCAQDALAQYAAMRVHQGERGVVADRADVAEMVGEPLEFRQQRAQPDCAVRHDKLQRRLGGLRKRIGIGDGAVARYASGELDGALETGAGHQPFDTLVGISQPLFQPDHGFPAGGKPEMSGLDDARMHRTDRNLMQAVAFDRQEAIGRRRRQRVDAISQREAHAPTIVIEPGAGVGQAFRRQSEQVVDGALQPKRRRVVLADRRIDCGRGNPG